MYFGLFSIFVIKPIQPDCDKIKGISVLLLETPLTRSKYFSPYTHAQRLTRTSITFCTFAYEQTLQDGSRGQGHSDRGRGIKWNPSQQYHDPGYQQQPQYADPNHYRPPPMGHQYRYPIPYEQYSYPQQQQYQPQRPPGPSSQATNICQLCQNQGHYDYQCQFAGDFMARTQKALNQGHSYNHQDSNQGEWSNGNNDNNDPNGQPFQ